MTSFLIICSAMIAYVAVLCATTLLSQPLRVRLVTAIDDLLDEKQWNARERRHLSWLANSCDSSVVGLMLPAAAFASLTAAVLGSPRHLDPELDRLRADERYNDLLIYYVGSVTACSPFAALISLPFAVGNAVVRAFRGDSEVVRSVEEPVLGASATFQPC